MYDRDKVDKELDEFIQQTMLDIEARKRLNQPPEWYDHIGVAGGNLLRLMLRGVEK